MARECDDCGTKIGGTFFEGGRDPERIKTCNGPSRHKICSECHGGWRESCPICGERLNR
jgi:hypothetical protein